ncbi:hypothetical protein [Streptomyces roseolus]|uniref:hypothetical protein n=1 Tax=Streptomyces roseolus TaxID=67358 RepID=UPI00364A637E
MRRRDPDTPLTYDEALRIARELAGDSGSLAAYPHRGLETARHGRGYAFTETIRSERGDLDGYVLVAENSHGSGILGVFGRTMETVIVEHLAKSEHDNREIPDTELGVPQRLALAAFDAGDSRVDVHGTDAATLDYAEYILTAMRRFPAVSGRNTLARNDHLLQPQDPARQYVHNCPLCTEPVMHNARYPHTVCDRCHTRTTDRAGRPIQGYNTSFSGGMATYYTDIPALPDGSAAPQEECVEVTRTGVCYIDGRPATIEEGRFGGIVVQLIATG